MMRQFEWRVSLLPLWYGKGIFYGFCAAAGGAFFIWKSVQLYGAPGRRTALANFSASLVQLGLLVLGAIIDNWVGSLA